MIYALYRDTEIHYSLGECMILTTRTSQYVSLIPIWYVYISCMHTYEDICLYINIIVYIVLKRRCKVWRRRSGVDDSTRVSGNNFFNSYAMCWTIALNRIPYCIARFASVVEPSSIPATAHEELLAHLSSSYINPTQQFSDVIGSRVYKMFMVNWEGLRWKQKRYVLYLVITWVMN